MVCMFEILRNYHISQVHEIIFLHTLSSLRILPTLIFAKSVPWFSSTFIVRDGKWSFKVMLGFHCQIVYWSGHHLLILKYVRFMYSISLVEFMKSYEEKYCCGPNMYLPAKFTYGSQCDCIWSKEMMKDK